MLLEFRTSNYKSFVSEMVFSMEPKPKQSGLDYSVMKENAGKKKIRGLCSAVIYGPNASGKTNIISAMDTMRAIVLRGNIRNEVPLSPDTASSFLELVPNCSSGGCSTSFYIRFTEKGYLIEYSLEMDLGRFMEEDYQRKILGERLVINNREVFFRNDTLSVHLPSEITPLVNRSIKRVYPKTIEIAQNSLNATELFLTNGFKSIFSQELVSLITTWFSSRFIVIYRSDVLRFSKALPDSSENRVYIDRTLTEAAKEFGISSNALGYRKNASDESPVLCSVFDDGRLTVPAEVFESFGTIRFINEFPLVINALVNGGTLVVDEFDASIHPMALMNIINVFHNDEININHAQLIFNTHNPVFLDAKLFRRDEIKFVERDEKTGASVHYSLADFKTASGVRKGENYMNNYFVDRYGAIKDVDFAPVLEKIITQVKEKKNV